MWDLRDERVRQENKQKMRRAKNNAKRPSTLCRNEILDIKQYDECGRTKSNATKHEKT